jgi:Putative zinc-finger
VPDHPDQEQLAAYQAGDVDRRERLDVEAHLAACPSCAELVASVGRARGSLALLEEPDLPPGLHDRLTTAVEAEAAARAVADGAAPAAGRLGSRRRAGSGNGSAPQRSGEADREPRVLRPAPWYRRPVAWGAAAALILAALVVPLLTQGGGLRTTAGGDTGAGGGAQEAATTQGQVAPSNLPVFRVKGEVTPETVRNRLETDPRAKAALSGAATPQATDQDGAALRSGAQTPGPEAPANPQPPAAGPAPAPATEAPSAGGPSARTQPLAPSPPRRQACLAAASAAATPATRPLSPAFYIEGAYKGRDVTILVTTSTSQPNRVDLWVFPRNSCTPVLATERVR